MPSYTDPLSIPFPNSGDSLRDAVSTIPQQAAERVDDLLSSISGVNPSGLVGVPTGTGWGATASGVYRRAAMAHLHLQLTRIGDTSWTNNALLGTVPVGYRPLSGTRAAAVLTATGAPVMCAVSADGNIYCIVGQPAGSAGLILDVCYAI